MADQVPPLSELEARNTELAKAAQEAEESLRRVRDAQGALRLQLEEARRNLPIKLQVLGLANERIRIKLDTYNEPIIAVLKGAPGRWYDSEKVENIIPIQSWAFIIDRLNKLDKPPELVFTNGVKEEIEKWIAQPHYTVDWSAEHDTFITSVPKGDAFTITHIPGAKTLRKEGKTFYLIPLIEAETLKKRLDSELTNRQYETDWTEIATAKVKEILGKRTKLDEIALLPDADISVDLGEGNELRPFQRVGVKFLDVAGGNVIVADQMGLGKTWQAVAYAKMHNFRTLVICKAALKVNWAREIIKLTGINPFILSGSVPTRYDIKELVLNKTPNLWTIINYDIFGSKVEYAQEHKLDDGSVAKSQMENRFPWAELLSMAKFDLIIIDEAHYIKNPDSNRSQASRALEATRFIHLTGTPVLNRPGELWAMLTLIAPGKFPSYEAFLDSYTWDGKRARNVDELRSMLKSLMIRRLKKDVMKELPEKNRIYHYHEPSPKALKIYNRILEGVYEVLRELNPFNAGNEQIITSILAKITRCKQVLAIDKMDHTADVAVELNDSSEEKNGAGKVIVFSQFKPVVYGIAKRLGNEAVVLTGDVSLEKRQAIIDQFQSDHTIRFLVATWQVAGEGLNMTAAGHVIFNDLFWTPANHEQCEDRAYGRLLDPHPIDSYYIIADVKIERWIQELLAAKLAVIQETVEGMEIDRTQSIAKDLLQRMKEDLRG